MPSSVVPTVATAPALEVQAKAALESVLVVSSPDRAALAITGKDRIGWLNGLVTCNLTQLGGGGSAAVYGLLVEKKGRIETDLFALAGADTLVLALPSELRDKTMATLDHYLIMEDAELSPRELAFFFVVGPRTADLVRAVSAPLSGTIDLLGLGGAILAGPDGAALEAEVRGALAPLGGVYGDQAGFEALRIERGVPRFGVEADTTMYPQEASLEKLAVAFDKGCYLGQEVVYMLENRGHVKKKLVPLDVDGDSALAKGARVTTPAGEEVGDVKSSVVGPASGKVRAIAMVKWAHAKPGTELRAAERGARVGAGVG